MVRSSAACSKAPAPPRSPMPLHPQARALIDRDPTRHLDFPAMSVPQVRAAMDARAKENAGSRVPVARTEDRAIVGPATMLHVRIYWPKDAPPGALPVYLYFHGGGYMVYSVETSDASCRYLANAARCIVVSLDYRLAPEARFPAPVHDCYAALLWLGAHVVSLGGDPRRLSAGGDSCGGALATVVAQLSRDRGGPSLRQIVMQGPRLEFKPPDPGAEGRMPLVTLMRRSYLPDPAAARDPRASPQLAADLSRLPPHFFVIGECDSLKPQSEAYAAKLRAANVAVEIREFPGMVHNFTCMLGALDLAKDGLDAIAGCLRKSLA
ncbi:MAG: alpha/beta hydrolase [Alphaproteobacteria bacterium]|nr:alpha/beta hydrolase [Alphaproteobacteria bacterium]